MGREVRSKMGVDHPTSSLCGRFATTWTYGLDNLRRCREGLPHALLKHQWMILLLHIHHRTVPVIVHVGHLALRRGVRHRADLLAAVRCQSQALVSGSEVICIRDFREVDEGIPKVVSGLEINRQVEEVIGTAKAACRKFCQCLIPSKGNRDVAKHQRGNAVTVAIGIADGAGHISHRRLTHCHRPRWLGSFGKLSLWLRLLEIAPAL
mmetsp:Transcript_35228/g.63509  ORF Transcript_35228/g.63509 Transcript_35228/m.63509 type:complete len:208 (+) Transcript_35228:105-728(+)